MRTVVLLLALAACTHPRPPQPAPIPAVDAVHPMILPALPLWTDKYTDDPAAYGPFFRISELMQAHDLSRLEAVEVQNQVRDLKRADPAGSLQDQFHTALAAVRNGDLESGLRQDDLDSARFIVVFDLDDTLYDQYYDRELAQTCHTFQVPRGDRTSFIQLAPHWAETFDAVRSNGGRIVLFSANLDAPTRDNLAHWMWEDQPVLTHPDIAGVLTNSYLIQQDKAEGSRKEPVPEPSKDLRIFDPTLERVIIVDDNPNRLVQLAHARVTAKFHADAWCDPQVDAPHKAALAGVLPTFTAELLDSLTWLDAHPQAVFQQAYLPYTHMGRVALQALMDAHPWTAAEAVAYLRDHPDMVDQRF